jgi:hypothetical protein
MRNFFEGDEELGDVCAILKIWITSFSYIILGEFSSFSYINFFQYFYLVVEPLTRGWRNGAPLIF